jgi:hypothetical protein
MTCSCIPACIGECSLEQKQKAKVKREVARFLDGHKWGQPEHRRYVVIEPEAPKPLPPMGWYMRCGHPTDFEEQTWYAISRPKGKRDFCDRCGKWMKAPDIPKPVEVLPEQPHF